MAKYALLVLCAATLGGCVGSPYETTERSASAGGSAPGTMMVKVRPDDGTPDRSFPTNYPNFRPGDRVFILADGRVIPQ